MGAGQPGGAVPGGEGAVGAHVGQPHQGVGHHADAAGRHQGDVLGRAPQGQRVVQAGRGVQRVVQLLGQALVDGVGVAQRVVVAAAAAAARLAVLPLRAELLRGSGVNHQGE